MNWALLILCSALFVELLIRANTLNNVRNMFTFMNKAGKVIRSRRISDHWKERCLPCYSKRLFQSSIFLFGTLLFALLPFLVVSAIAPLLHMRFLELLSSFQGIIISCVIATVYAKTRHFLFPRRL